MVGVIFFMYVYRWNRNVFFFLFPKLSICWSDLLVSFSLQTYQFQETNHTPYTHPYFSRYQHNNNTSQQHQTQSKTTDKTENRKTFETFETGAMLYQNIQKLYYPNVTENRIYIILRDTF